MISVENRKFEGECEVYRLFITRTSELLVAIIFVFRSDLSFRQYGTARHCLPERVSEEAPNGGPHKFLRSQHHPRSLKLKSNQFETIIFSPRVPFTYDDVPTFYGVLLFLNMNSELFLITYYRCTCANSRIAVWNASALLFEQCPTQEESHLQNWFNLR